MEAKLKSGKVIKGKAASILIAKGIAKEVEPVKAESAKDVIDKINNCESIESLIEFKNDTRKTVKLAYSKKLKELE